MSDEFTILENLSKPFKRTHLPFRNLTDWIDAKDIQAEQVADGWSEIKIDVGTGVHDVSTVPVHLGRGQRHDGWSDQILSLMTPEDLNFKWNLINKMLWLFRN